MTLAKFSDFLTPFPPCHNVWPGASWSSTENGGGGWKMSHHFTEETFRQIMLSPHINSTTGEVEVYCVTKVNRFKNVSDVPINLTLAVRVKNFTSFGVALERKVLVGSLKALDSKRIFSEPLESLLSGGGCSKRFEMSQSLQDCYIDVSLLQGKNGTEVYSNSANRPTKRMLQPSGFPSWQPMW